jgi:hypothetical protein
LLKTQRKHGDAHSTHCVCTTCAPEFYEFPDYVVTEDPALEIMCEACAPEDGAHSHSKHTHSAEGRHSGSTGRSTEMDLIDPMEGGNRASSLSAPLL